MPNLVDVDPGLMASTLSFSWVKDYPLRAEIEFTLSLALFPFRAGILSVPEEESLRRFAKAETSDAMQFHFRIRATLYSIVEFDLKFLPVPVTAYSQTSTLRSR